VNKITSIKKQKNGKRLNIYLDEQFGFGIDLDNFVKFNLKLEQELSAKQVKNIVREVDFSKNLEKILKFAMIRPRSEKEIKDWFGRKKVPKSIQDDLVERLIKYDLVGDLKFAKWWVEQRARFRPRSMRQLMAELRQKGVERKIIEEVLMQQEVDELAIEKKLVKKNIKKWNKFDQGERKRKISEFLGRKGFDWEVIREVIE
jgi:regulatory protein